MSRAVGIGVIVAGTIALAVVPRLLAQGDAIPPPAVSDLRAVDRGADWVTLSWTAPGSAASYDLRYATHPIDSEEDFVRARRARSGRAGETERVTVSGLSRATIYYFSLRAADGASSWSGLSNEASGNTHFEGYGYATRGGSGSDVFHVTSLADAGPGTLREGVEGNRSGPRTIVFDVGGVITLLSDIRIRADAGTDHVTIDGRSAPAPGITVRKQPCPPGLTSCPVGHACITDGEFKIGAGGTVPTSEVIVTAMRFQGNYQLSWGACGENSAATIGVQYFFENVVLDHLTIRNGSDSSPDLWTGEFGSSNVTYSSNLIAFSNHPLTISGSGGGGSRSNISIHHNVLARSGERLPQVRGETRDFDFRNNVIFDWRANGSGSYGMRIRNDDGAAGTRRVNANVVNNYFINGNGNPRFAFYYARGAGSESSTADGDGGPASCTTADGCARCPPQGTVVGDSFMGELWVSGNVFPPEVCEKYSTVSAERVVPANAVVTTQPAADLARTLLPHVGARYRLPDEQSLLEEIAAAMGEALRPAAPTGLRIVPR